MGVGRIVCVCVMCMYCLSSSCVLDVISPFTVARNFKFFLFFPLIFETSSDCGPFLICTSVYSQAPGSKIFFY